MSVRAKKIPKTAAPEKATKNPARKRWSVHVNPAAHYKNAKAEAHVSAERLRLAAMQSQPLPYRKELEVQFDADLSGIRVFQGPEVDAALEAEDALAGVQGEAVLLSAKADKPVVAHEVAHILQQRATGPRATGEAAENEALEAEALVAANHPVPDVSAGLDPGAVAFRRLSELEEAQPVVGSDREASQDFQLAAEGTDAPDAGTTDEESSAETEEAQAPAEGSGGAGAMEAVDLGEPIPDDPVPTFEPAAMPEIDVDEAAADAAAAEAEAALEGTEDADGLMGAFKDAPPSIKAMHHDQIDGKVGDMAIEDQAAFEADLPEFQAEMSGANDLAEPEPVQTPEAQDAQLEDGTPAPPPEPEVDPTPDPGIADLNASGNSLVSSWFTEGDADGLGRAFNNVSTDDNEVETSAGERPEVPLEGASDPQRVADQDEAARTEATSNRQEATQGVLDGPGPEQVELQEVREEFTMEARETPQIDQAEGPVEGAAGFRDKELDKDVVALFDAHHNETMASSMEAATAEVGTAVESRNTERDAKVAETEAKKDRLNAEADESQRDEVGNRRQDVQDARQTAVDAQAQHVSDVETEADTQRTTAQTEIDTQVSTTETQVTADFNKAETDAEAEVTAGERKAEKERQKQEREAEDLSWWERAASWVVDQFDKLTTFINDVFDVVRSAVSAIIDKVKEAALALIDLAASAIIAAIEKLGEALKTAVNALLAEHFPAVAAALNDAIDSAVEVATEVVNTVAEGLKAAVSFLLDALAAGLDAILAAYQAAVNAALAIARAALTGDWGALAKLILEPVLMALGIQPAAFYAVIAKAVEALDIIIDDPIGFLANLVDAFVGGVRKFGTNFLTHLQAGIISWLTGALGGGIQIPAKFDLAGVLDLAQQILGLTVDMIRRVAVRVLGEEAVERIEFFMGYLVELITGGFSALWDKIMADLSNLKDMVLDAIKSFLVERVIMAAISWLAGLFSPVGALVKLVMTIWNFIMFLKDQLSRIIQVVQTIVSTMWEIATGVLQPAMQGVENVLGRLLPIAIDLLARLLGLGNVAGKVKEIINNVRQRIEDAIVNLINRVLSAFTGGRVSGSAGEEDADGGDLDASEMMQPMTFGNEEKSHTLYLEERGEDVVPMMRSEPLPIETWLQGLVGDGSRQHFTVVRELVDQRTINNKVAEVDKLARKALGLEDELDEESDREVGGDPRPTLARTGGQLTRVLNQIMEQMGAGESLLAQVFSANVSDMHPVFQDQMTLILRSISDADARQMRENTWEQMIDVLWAHSATPNIWKRPAQAGAVIRQKESVSTRFEEAVKDVVQVKYPNALSTEQEVNSLFADFLIEQLNQSGPARAIFGVLLTGSGTDMANVAAAVSTQIIEAADAMTASGAEGPDIEIKEDIKGSTIFPRMREYVDKDLDEGPRTYHVWANNDRIRGSSTGPYNLLTMITDANATERKTRNAEHVGDAIRGAGPVNRPHEWIQASTADMVMQHAANATKSGDGRAIKAASELIQFQELVRTSTTKLIFKPGADFSGGHVVVRYKAKAHRESDEYRDASMAKLPVDKRAEWYPASGPKEGDEVGVLQAHSGGLYAFAHGGGFRESLVSQAVGSTAWHNTLKTRVDESARKLMRPPYDADELKGAIIGHYRETIWQGDINAKAASGKFFQNYYRSQSVGSAITYSNLKSEFSKEFETVVTQIEDQIDAVVGG